MAKTIYQNNSVEITIDRQNSLESEVNVNGQNLIWISNSEEEEFIKELNSVLDKYRI